MARTSARRPCRRVRPAHVRGQPVEPGGLEDRIVFVQGDIADGDLAERVVRDERIDTIVNFAAESHNSLAVVDPTRFFRTNVLGTQALLDVARAVGDVRFHHVSTCEVYGDLALDSDDAFTEDHPYRPRTPYNASKASARPRRARVPRDVRTADHDHELLEQLRAVPVPREGDPALPRRTRSTTSRSRSTRRRRTSASGCTSTTTAVRSSSCSREGRIGETYNVGSGFEASIEEIADAILDLAGKPHDLKTIVPDRPGHDRRYLLDSTKLRQELGWEPRWEFAAGPRRHRALVHRAPRVVGAAQGARAGRRDGLALAPGHAPHCCLAAVTSGCEPSSCSRRSRYGSASSQRSSSASDLPML